MAAQKSSSKMSTSDQLAKIKDMLPMVSVPVTDMQKQSKTNTSKKRNEPTIQKFLNCSQTKPVSIKSKKRNPASRFVSTEAKVAKRFRKIGDDDDEDYENGEDAYESDDGFTVEDGDDDGEDAEYPHDVSDDEKKYHEDDDEEEDDKINYGSGDDSDSEEEDSYNYGGETDSEEEEEDSEDDLAEDASDDSEGEAKIDEAAEAEEAELKEQEILLRKEEMKVVTQIGRSTRGGKMLIDYRNWARMTTLIFMDQWGKSRDQAPKGRYYKATKLIYQEDGIHGLSSSSSSSSSKPSSSSKGKQPSKEDASASNSILPKDRYDMLVVRVLMKLPVVLANAMIKTIDNKEDHLYKAMTCMKEYVHSRLGKSESAKRKCAHCKQPATDKLLIKCEKEEVEDRNDKHQWESTFFMCSAMLNQMKMFIWFTSLFNVLKPEAMKSLAPKSNLIKTFNTKKYQEGIKKNGFSVYQHISEKIISKIEQWAKDVLIDKMYFEVPTSAVV